MGKSTNGIGCEDDGECCTAGGFDLELPKSFLMAWDVPRYEIDEKSLYILRLTGLHLLKMSETDKDRVVDLLRDILQIK